MNVIYVGTQVVVNILFIAFGVWLIYRAQRLFKNKNKHFGGKIVMVVLYCLGIIILLSIISEIVQGIAHLIK